MMPGRRDAVDAAMARPPNGVDAQEESNNTARRTFS